MKWYMINDVGYTPMLATHTTFRIPRADVVLNIIFLKLHPQEYEILYVSPAFE